MNHHGRSFASVLCLAFIFTFAAAARAQESDAPKVEVGVQATSLSVRSPDIFGTRNEPGFGGRVSYNFTDYFAVEAEGNFFPGDDSFSTQSTGGSIQQLQAGVKAGKRFNRFGIFAKARPGFVSFSETQHVEAVPGSGPFPFANFSTQRKTHFSMDVGGVLEFYPSRRLLVRFDFGDTIIRYGERDDFAPFIFPGVPSGVVTLPSEVTHTFQFSGGVGWRFGGGTGPEEDFSTGGDDRFDGERRFEVGAQFTSLVLRRPRPANTFPTLFPGEEETDTEAGFGARVGYNLTDNVAVEAEGNFFPRRSFPFFTNNATGGYPAQLQAGVKAGKRFKRFGVFAKARPGFVTFSRVRQRVGLETIEFSDGTQFTFGRFEDRRKTYFSMDVGGVVEFYHSKRLFTRFDFGDTIIRYPERDQTSFLISVPFVTAPAETQHNLQFSAGIGLRF